MLYVTGAVGAAAAGLGMAPGPGRRPRRMPDAAALIERHRRPVPRLRVGALLGRTRSATACMDLSDGLADAVSQLAQASGTGAVDRRRGAAHPGRRPPLVRVPGTGPGASRPRRGRRLRAAVLGLPAAPEAGSGPSSDRPGASPSLESASSPRRLLSSEERWRDRAAACRVHPLLIAAGRVHGEVPGSGPGSSSSCTPTTRPSGPLSAYALGVFFGFSPLLGLHTVLGLIFAFALNLNRVAVLLGVYSNLPWILVPYYTLATWLGATILRTRAAARRARSGSVDGLENRSWTEFRTAAVALKPVLWAFTLGSTIGAVLLALIAYRVSFVMITTHRQRLHRSQHTEL